MERHVIDLWEDGVRLTHEKMCANAGVDISEVMDYDMPCSGSLGVSSMYNSDLHVEWEDHVEPYDLDADLAMDWDIAPFTYGDEHEPGHTKSPYERPGHVSDLPGLFGQALTAYGNACAIMESSGYDTDEYTKYFCNDWGIPMDITMLEGEEEAEYKKKLEEVEKMAHHVAVPRKDQHMLLRAVVPSLRSTGSAMWGGISRKLEPYCAAMPSASPSLKVVSHSVHRKKFDRDVLIDWSRIKEIARVIGVQLYCDDEFAKGVVHRLDLSVDPREPPTAPKLDLKPVKINIEVQNVNSMLDTMAVKYYMSQFAKHKDKLLELEPAKTVLLHKETDFTGFEVSQYAKDVGVQRFNIPDPTDHEPMEIIFPERKTIKFPKNLYPVTAEHLLKLYAVYAAERNQLKDYREWDILALSEAARSGDIKDEDKAKLRKIVRIVYPEQFLSSASTLWHMAFPKNDIHLTSELKSFLNLRPGIMQEHNFVKFWRVVTDDNKALGILGYTIYQAVGERNKNVRIVIVNRAKTSDVNNPVSVIDTIFTERKNYWTMRYRANSRYGEEKRVLYQQLAAYFPLLQFEVKKGGLVNVLYDNVIRRMSVTVKRYVKKRKKKDIDVKIPRSIEHVVAGEFDDIVKRNDVNEMKPLFGSVAKALVTRAEDFKKDIVSFTRGVINRRLDLDDDEEFKRREVKYKDELDVYIPPHRRGPGKKKKKKKKSSNKAKPKDDDAPDLDSVTGFSVHSGGVEEQKYGSESYEGEGHVDKHGAFDLWEEEEHYDKSDDVDLTAQAYPDIEVHDEMDLGMGMDDGMGMEDDLFGGGGDEDDLFGGGDFASGEPNLVNLYDELKENISNISQILLDSVVEEHGEYVTVSEFRIILDSTRKTHILAGTVLRFDDNEADIE